MFYLHSFVRRKNMRLSYSIAVLFLFIPSKENSNEPSNLISLWTNTRKNDLKNLSVGESASVQGNIYHTAAHRKDRLPVDLTRLLEKETEIAVSPIIADSIVCDLNSVHLCIRNFSK